jgi:hypothetical protein
MSDVLNFIAAHAFWAHLIWTVGCFVLLLALLPAIWARPRFDRRSGPLGRRALDQPWFEPEIYVDFFKKRGYSLTDADISELLHTITKRGATYERNLH